MSLSEVAEALLEKFKTSSWCELADVLPSALTSDAHILEAQANFDSAKSQWETFHRLSLTHFTLLYHRLAVKLLRKERVHGGSEESERKHASLSGAGSDLLRPSSSTETRGLLEQLPPDWTVVQLTSEGAMSGIPDYYRKIDGSIPTPSLFISRCRCGTSPSVLIQKIPAPKASGAVRSILDEMDLIRKENKVLGKSYKDVVNKYMEKKDELNNRLRCLVRSIETSWLQHYSLLFMGSMDAADEHLFRQKVAEVLATHGYQNIEDEKKLFFELLVSSPLPSDKADALSSALSVRATASKILGESVRSSKISKLSNDLKEIMESKAHLRAKSRNPVILVLDKAIIGLPWEMLRIVQNQAVTRMPSLHSLALLYQNHAQKMSSVVVCRVDPVSGYFILDPDNNLPRTQNRLKECFDSTNWVGVTGTKPSQKECTQALKDKDIFVYVGHGSGSQYLPANLIETLPCRSLVLLYGCSSVALSQRGMATDPWGVVMNYLMAECPCIVGMLWEVMDKDTDRLTKEMVGAITGQNSRETTERRKASIEHITTKLASLDLGESEDVPTLVSKARPLCNWYLISAALVVYGLPLGFKPGSDCLL